MNRYLITISLIISLLIVIFSTTYKVIKNYERNINLVEEKYIIETAKKCINEKKCDEEKITLEKLYELGMLEKQVNKVTKEYYKSSAYVIKKGDKYIFVK